MEKRFTEKEKMKDLAKRVIGKKRRGMERRYEEKQRSEVERKRHTDWQTD